MCAGVGGLGTEEPQGSRGIFDSHTPSGEARSTSSVAHGLESRADTGTSARSGKGRLNNRVVLRNELEVDNISIVHTSQVRGVKSKGTVGTDEDVISRSLDRSSSREDSSSSNGVTHFEKISNELKWS